MKMFIVEGNRQKLDGGAMFGHTPKTMWSRWVEPDHLNRIDIACRSLLIETDAGLKILLEAGIGSFFEPALKDRYGVVEDDHCLLKNLANLGFGHEQIDHVILSHLHFDHIGGLFSAWQKGCEPELLFPNACIWVGERHWQHALAPHFRDRASFISDLNQQLLTSGRLRLLTEENQLELPANLRVYFSDGHTPGLILTEITTPQGPLLFSSDLIPGRHWVHLPICMGYDRFPERLADEKRQLLADLLRRNGRLFFTHDADMACGRVLMDERGRYCVEAAPLK